MRAVKWIVVEVEAQSRMYGLVGWIHGTVEVESKRTGVGYFRELVTMVRGSGVGRMPYDNRNDEKSEKRSEVDR